jgi:hypothetical protein
MRTKVTIHELLRCLSRIDSGQEVFEAEASDPLECLSAALERFPSMREWTHREDGTLSPQVWFFVNGERMPDSETARTLQEGDEVLIFFNHV